MEIRKVQRTGGSTFVVSLPKAWAIANGVEAGHRLSMADRPDGALVVFPTEAPAAPRCVIVVEADGLRPSGLERRVRAALMAGADAVTVRAPRGFTTEQADALRQVCASSVGAQITEEGDREVVIEDLSDASDLTIRRGLRRMHLLAAGAVRDGVAAAKGEPGAARWAELKAAEAERLAAFLEKEFRLLLEQPGRATRLGSSVTDAHDDMLAVRALRRAIAHGARLASIVPTARASATTRRLAWVGTTLEAAVRAHVAGDLALADQVLDEIETARRETPHGVPDAAWERIDRLLDVMAELASLAVVTSYARSTASK